MRLALYSYLTPLKSPLFKQPVTFAIFHLSFISRRSVVEYQLTVRRVNPPPLISVSFNPVSVCSPASIRAVSVWLIHPGSRCKKRPLVSDPVIPVSHRRRGSDSLLHCPPSELDSLLESRLFCWLDMPAYISA